MPPRRGGVKRPHQKTDLVGENASEGRGDRIKRFEAGGKGRKKENLSSS